MIERNRRANLHSDNKETSKKDKQERKSRRAVDHSVDEWKGRVRRKGVHEFVTWLAVLSVSCVETWWEILACAQGRSLIGLSAFRLSQWEWLYRNPQLLGASIRRMAARSSEFLSKFTAISQSLQDRLSEMSPAERAAWVSALLRDPEQFPLDVGPTGESLRRQFESDPDGCMSPTVIDSTDLRTPEVQFFLTVYLPAMLLIATSPHQLLRRAEAGDLAAVCELIRIDPLAAHLPSIQEFRWRLTQQNRTAELAAIRTAESEPIDTPKSRGELKVAIAAELIHASRMWAKAAGNESARLNKTDLWNLLDLIAKRRGQGNDSQDLPSYVAFQKAVGRHEPILSRAKWDIFAP